MKEILIIVSCVPLYVVNSFCDKYVSLKNGNKYNFLYNCIKFLIGSLCLILPFLLDRSPKFAPGVILCGVACGVMYAISKTLMLKGYEKTSVAFMTLCHSSGMILPCVMGYFFWSEELDFLSVIGIFLAVTSIVMLKDSKSDKKRFEITGIMIGITIFLASGGIMIVQKLMGIYFADQSISAYNFYSFLIPFFILCFFVGYKEKENKEKNNKKDIKIVLICAIGSAVSLCIISFVMTTLAGSVPSIILFPLFNGLGIISVCVGSVFAFKEKLTTKKIIGLVLGICGLCLVSI